MKEYVLDYERLQERRKAHSYLKKRMEFPDYYGRNLDALFDCLTELGECTIVLKKDGFQDEAEGYGAKIQKVLEEAAGLNPNLKLEIQYAEHSSPSGRQILE